MSPPYTLSERVSLAARNTLRVDVSAAWLACVTDASALDELLGLERFTGLPVMVLGEGSNVLFIGDFPGLVVTLDLQAIERVDEDAASVLLRVGAGVGWDPLVDWTLRHGLEGLENLALIPGLAGAAPIQNIGAYGVEIGEFVDSVTAWDRQTRRLVRLANADCAFGYRDSRFKREMDRWIVTAVDLRLPRHRELRLDYAGVREELNSLGVGIPRAADVATAIRRLRRRKLPDPRAIGNAGSFFKNPVVTRRRFESLLAAHPSLPHYPTRSADQVKLSAAWLIEACGLKGLRAGDAGISAQHALVLVNHGHASGQELLDLARRVIDAVVSGFDIELEPEPRIIGSAINRPQT